MYQYPAHRDLALMKIINIENILPRHKALSILQKLSLFNGVLDREFEELLEICVISKFHAGQQIFEQGNSAQSLFVVLNGVVEISTPEKGVINIMKQGEVFGELGVITSMPRLASASTLLDNTLLLEIKKSDLDFLIGREPHLSYGIMRNLADELAQRFVQVNKENFSTRSHFTPIVKNVSTQLNQLSGPILISHDEQKMEQVSHYYITRIHNGGLFSSDGQSNITTGSLVSIEEAEPGLTFKLKAGCNQGWFDVHLTTQENKFMRDSDKARVYIFGYESS